MLGCGGALSVLDQEVHVGEVRAPVVGALLEERSIHLGAVLLGARLSQVSELDPGAVVRVVVGDDLPQGEATQPGVSARACELVDRERHAANLLGVLLLLGELQRLLVTLDRLLAMSGPGGEHPRLLQLGVRRPAQQLVDALQRFERHLEDAVVRRLALLLSGADTSLVDLCQLQPSGVAAGIELHGRLGRVEGVTDSSRGERHVRVSKLHQGRVRGLLQAALHQAGGTLGVFERDQLRLLHRRRDALRIETVGLAVVLQGFTRPGLGGEHVADAFVKLGVVGFELQRTAKLEQRLVQLLLLEVRVSASDVLVQALPG